MIDILKAIPHRPPFLFVDNVVEMDDRKIVAEKVFAHDLDFFKGHYPNFPLAPGVLILESVFQAAAILLSKRVAPVENGIPALTRIKDAKFKKIVRPGEKLTLEAQIEDAVGAAFYMKGRAKTDDGLVASVSFTCAMIDAEKLA